MWQTNLSKQSFVGSLDFLPLGIAAGRQQLQDGVLVSPCGKDGVKVTQSHQAHAVTFPLQLSPHFT